MSLVKLRQWGTRAAAAVLFRYVCFVVMIALSLWAESRPAPHLPDLLIDRIPYFPSVDRYNYWLLALGYVPMAGLLLWRDPARFCRYCVSAGMLSVVRGVCIVVTGLGPVRGPDLHAGMFDRDPSLFWRALLEMSSPIGTLLRDAPHVYLTKDLFFSGHTAATGLLLLYVWPYVSLRYPMLVAHVAVVVSVFLAHLHYTIDVLGAYAMALALFALREGWPHGLAQKQ